MSNEHITYLENLKRLYVTQAARCETDEERQENNKVVERTEALITRLGMTPLKG